MKRLTLYILFATLITALLSISIMAEEDLEFEQKYNKQDNPIKFWHFQISTPSTRADYPPSFLWYSGGPYMDSTLTPFYGNQIYIKKDIQE